MMIKKTFETTFTVKGLNTSAGVNDYEAHVMELLDQMTAACDAIEKSGHAMKVTWTIDIEEVAADAGEAAP